MVNNEKFTKRLQQILIYHDLSAASFADKIKVGRSSISHILSGRNKPSLDFVLKVKDAFPEIEMDWLLSGKGKFPESQIQNEITPSPSETFGMKNGKMNLEAKKTVKLKKIVFIYEDGSFEVFEN